ERILVPFPTRGLRRQLRPVRHIELVQVELRLPTRGLERARRLVEDLRDAVHPVCLPVATRMHALVEHVERLIAAGPGQQTRLCRILPTEPSGLLLGAADQSVQTRLESM